MDPTDRESISLMQMLLCEWMSPDKEHLQPDPAILRTTGVALTNTGQRPAENSILSYILCAENGDCW